VGKDEQSLLPSADKDADTRNVYKVASYCTQCRWHIDVVVDSRDNGAEGRPCRKGDAEFILHHFRFEGDNATNGSVGLGSQVAPRTYTFTCSAPQCPAKVHIHMRPPHLSDQDIETLTNQARLRKRWEDAKQIAGERADATMARRVDGPDFLNTYLQDSLNPVKGKTRIPLLKMRTTLKAEYGTCRNLEKLRILLNERYVTQSRTSDASSIPSSSASLRMTVSARGTSHHFLHPQEHILREH
jgi:ubiquitin carboxyl-terminal hydrolase 25/28